MGGNYRLITDITLSSSWTPLGSQAAPFTGTLDGGGHTIRNLTISNTQQSNQGLFGFIGSSGKVMNLRVENAFVTAADSAGILAGVNQGTIRRVSVQGIITGANAVGGLAGTNSGQITDSYSIATVSGRDMVGGLVGNNTGPLANTYAVGKVSKALTNTYLGFDGVDDYVSIPHNDAYVDTGSYTLEAWFNWTVTDRQTVQFIVGMGLEEFEIHTGGFEPIKANGIRYIPINRVDDVRDQSSAYAYNDAHNVLQPGWNHVAVIWDLAHTQARIYLNGIPQNIFQNNINVGTTATIPLNPAVTNPLAANEEDLYIGARNDQNAGMPGYFFQGNIADVRLWNRVRTPEEISADKNARLTGFEAGLVGYWPLDETSGSTIRDHSVYGNHGFLHTDFDGTFTDANATRVQVNGTSGGLVGSNSNPGTVANSYYDSTVNPVTDPSPYGTPLNTLQMKTQSSFAGWEFDYTWDIVEGSSYPTLTGFDVTLNQASSQADPTNVSPVNFTVDFSKPIDSSSFTAEDVSISAGTCTPSVEVTAVTPYDNTNFNIAVSGLTGSCTVSASIPAGTVQNTEGTFFNASTSTDNQVAFDGAVPDVTINQAGDQADPTNTSPVYFTVVFSKPIDAGRFSVGDVTLGGTVTGSVTNIIQMAPFNNTTFRIKVGNLTGEGTLTASIPAGKVTDPVGNLNNASTSDDNTITYDSQAPSLEISSPVDTLTRTAPFMITLTFSEPVTGFEVGDITVSNGTAGSLLGSGSSYTALITPTVDGEVVVQVAADIAADAAGNGNTQAAPWSIVFDSNGPLVNLNQVMGQADPANTGPIYFTAVFNEPINTGSFTADDVLITGGTGAVVTDISQTDPNDGTAFLITVNGMTSNGDITLSLPADKVTDPAGNPNTASFFADNTVTYDSSAPTVTIDIMMPFLATKSSPIYVMIQFSETVSGFDAGDIVVDNGSVGDFSGFMSSYDLSIFPTTEGLVTISVPAGAALDASGNPNMASESVSFTYDVTRPSVTVEQATSQADPTNLQPVHFTAVFNESLDTMSLHPGCVQLSGTAAGAAIPMITEIAPFDRTVFDISVIGMMSDGTVSISIPESCVSDAAMNFNTASTSVDNIVTYDTTHVSVVISSSESDPTNTSPIPVTFTFSKDVTGFELSDLTVENGTPGSLSGSGSIYTAEITPTADGQVTVDVPADVVTDAAGNGNEAANQFAIQYDGTAPSVTVDQASDQADPTNSMPIHFTAVFSKPVNPDSFTVEDVTLSGETGAVVAGITETEPNDGTTFDISVDSLTADGVVSASILEDLVEDLAGNTNTASTGADNSVSYETSGPSVPETSLKLNYTKKGPGSFTITFSKPVYNPQDDTDPDDVTNPANYLLFERGANKLFDTVSCELGLAEDDVQVPVASVTYEELTYTSTVLLNEALPVGRYKLLVCGTTSIVDLALNPLNGGIDLVYNITVSPESQDDDNAPAASTALPNSGFTPGRITLLLPQSAEKAYTGTDLILDIPTLGVSATIVGVPNQDNSWDVSWLGNQAGYLYGSAYPTWAGNTVLTGHVWDADNTPGIFANIRNLRYGDRFHIHAFGKTYTYEVRESSLVSGSNVPGVFKSEELDWVTLLTCEGYQIGEDGYAYRRMVRAVLVEMK